MLAEPTTRSYTLRLSGVDNWQEFLWQTHLAVNRAAWVWGDWLLTLRGGLPPDLSAGYPERRVLLALSWLSVESPKSLVPNEPGKLVVAYGDEAADVRSEKVTRRFAEILDRLRVLDKRAWTDACEPALSARIRSDAVWVDRSAAFGALRDSYPGLTGEWETNALFDFLGGEEAYFAMPDTAEAPPPEAKDFVQKAGGWLSRNWGSGEKSDSTAISNQLQTIAKVPSGVLVGCTGNEAVKQLLCQLGADGRGESEAKDKFKVLKQAIGWKGRSSKGAIALDKLATATSVTAELWEQIRGKVAEEAAAQAGKGAKGTAKPSWMDAWRQHMETRIGIPYRTTRDLIWEHGVALDHALRRVSSAHSWIKRAEVERRQFQEAASKTVSPVAKKWLDDFCDRRSDESGAVGDYVIQRRAIDGWKKVVQSWAALPEDATETSRVQAARDVQSNLEENEKFGDNTLFERLATDDAKCVWLNENGRANADLLEDYSAATVAANNQRRFKVPAYRHPDPLRNPIYVDFGNSRWGIAYSALSAAHQQASLAQKLAKAKTDKAREKLRKQAREVPDLRSVRLDLWTGEAVTPVTLRWQAKRLWKDLDLEHFGAPCDASVTRADRLGRGFAERADGPVSVVDVFAAKDWNGRLQVARTELDQIADVIYGKENGVRLGADYARLDLINENPQARRKLDRLTWFITTSAKLRPSGPWLDLVAKGLPEGMEYRKGRTGTYLHYEANKDRKGRARLQLARIPGLRVLSFDLGHRYAAACAVWESLNEESLRREVAGREVVTGSIKPGSLYLHTRHQGKDGKQRTTIYRRTGPVMWARLERQFVIRLQGEIGPARNATLEERQRFEELLRWVDEFTPNAAGTSIENPRFVPVNDLHEEAVRLARFGMKRLGDAARIAFILTATTKPISGGRTATLNHEERVAYLQDGLVLWNALAKGKNVNRWAAAQWEHFIVPLLGAGDLEPPPEEIARAERKKRIEALRDSLKPAAEKLFERDNSDLHELWRDHWREQVKGWQRQLHWLRRLILPRIGQRPRRGEAAYAAWKRRAKELRRSGGLSVQRLRSIRELYRVLKSFRMRPEPDDLRKNVPMPGDESLANFGRRILNQLDRLRQQRIKQLASRVVEAALGMGSENPAHRNGRKRPSLPVFAPCHVVVAENLEHYRPEETRLRRENRQLMDWSARNVRKLIMEGCELNGLHFIEVSPSYTSRQDSRTGAPGIRCEDVPRGVLEMALSQANGQGCAQSKSADRNVGRVASEIRRINQTTDNELSARQKVLKSAIKNISNLPPKIRNIRLPRRGGEVFVSADGDSSASKGLQADLNAAANIGLKALADPDEKHTWWFVLTSTTTGKPDPDQIKGSLIWSPDDQVLPPALAKDVKRPKSGKKTKTSVYAWNPQYGVASEWQATQPYWLGVESAVASKLVQKLQ